MFLTAKQAKIWLIGGTSDSVSVAKLLVEEKVLAIITVTTPSAINLYLDSPYLKIRVGKLESDASAEAFCQQEQITGIIDASHPYAIAISQRAIAISQKLHIPYLRYERPSVEITSPQVTYCDSFTTLTEGNYLQGQRVLLTTGCNTLKIFQYWQSKATLYTRILPSVNSLQMATEAGFTPERIMAMRPPFTFDLELALWRHWDISLVVSKANGKAGGEDIKQKVASTLNIPLIIITRPQLVYPQVTDNQEDIMTFIVPNNKH